MNHTPTRDPQRWMADYAPASRVTGSGRCGIPTTPLGRRLRELRGDRTQADMASLLGVNAKQISNWEMGINLPTLVVLQRYAKAIRTNAAGCLTVARLLDGVL